MLRRPPRSPRTATPVPYPTLFLSGLGLLIPDDAALLQSDEQHYARLEPPFADDPLLRDRQHAALGCHDDPVVVGDGEAGGPQAIAVQGRADLPPVCEGDGGRAVPRLHQSRMIFVEGAPRSEEHTSELQSLMRISYAVFCLK